MKTRAGILSFLVLADVATTTAALQAGGREANTFMEGMVLDPATHLVIKILGLVLLVLLLEVGMREYLIHRNRCYCALWTMYGGLAVNNLLWLAIIAGGVVS